MSKKHRGEEHEEHVDESWLIPYADLLTLLLALFIVLFAASNVDKQKYVAIATAFQAEIMSGAGMTYIPGFTSAPSIYLPPEVTDDLAEANEQAKLEALQASLQVYLQENGLGSEVTTSIDDRGLVISMNNAVLFDSGSADIRPEYMDILVKIGEAIDKLDNYIRVEGHTDDVPTNSERFPTNWELSSARATSVVRLFEDQSHIAPQKLMAVGYGEFKPVEENTTPEGRKKNRRVDVIILSSRFNSLEGAHPQ